MTTSRAASCFRSPRQMALIVLLLAANFAWGAFDRCSYKTNSAWSYDEANRLHAHNVTTDTIWVAGSASSSLSEGHNETWVRMSVTSSMWEGGVMDCNARDDLVVPDRYTGDPEARQVWYDCMPRPGTGLTGASHYWLQVAVNGIAPGESQKQVWYSSMTFNETFTCEDDPDYMYVDDTPILVLKTMLALACLFFDLLSPLHDSEHARPVDLTTPEPPLKDIKNGSPLMATSPYGHAITKPRLPTLILS
jgi:hypothetical protein